MGSVKRLAEWIKEADTIAVLTGAGMSTESGIPDFRSENGLYAQEERVEYYLSEHYYQKIRLIFGVDLSGCFH
ncbi:NAD-dependent protein deacetylase [Geobacillus sp. BCO2]|nr:NAD-dependent protein deacetylase [Geobacillus sp. BCO2]